MTTTTVRIASLVLGGFIAAAALSVPVFAAGDDSETMSSRRRERGEEAALLKVVRMQAIIFTALKIFASAGHTEKNVGLRELSDEGEHLFVL